MASALRLLVPCGELGKSRGEKPNQAGTRFGGIRPWLSSLLAHVAFAALAALIVLPRAATEPQPDLITTLTDYQAADASVAELDLTPVAIVEPQETPLDMSLPGGSMGMELSPALPMGQRSLPSSLAVRNGLATPMLLTPIKAAGTSGGGHAQRRPGNGLAGILDGRGDGTRGRLVVAFGGSEASERAVILGLDWLARHQNPDGSWSLDGFGRICNGRCDGYGVQCDMAGTGLGVLPFLAAGQTPTQKGKYQIVVKRALSWLVAHQQNDGSLTRNDDHMRVRMYGHGIATIALCEAYAMTQTPGLRVPAQRALDFIALTQDPQGGGWRYLPREQGDTSVAGWQVLALATGRMGDLEIAPEVEARASVFLDTMGSSRYVYHRPDWTLITPAMTAEALLCRVFLGWPQDHPDFGEGVRWLLQTHLPGRRDVYYWYYGTQLMHHMEGEAWSRWNRVIRDRLVNTQINRGHAAGSWDPMLPEPDMWGKAGGRVYVTSLSVLTLQVYYRHLPVYEERLRASLGRESREGASQPSVPSASY